MMDFGIVHHDNGVVEGVRVDMGEDVRHERLVELRARERPLPQVPSDEAWSQVC